MKRVFSSNIFRIFVADIKKEVSLFVWSTETEVSTAAISYLKQKSQWTQFLAM